MPSLGFGCTSGRDPTSGMLQRYKRSVSMSSLAAKNGPEWSSPFCLSLDMCEICPFSGPISLARGDALKIRNGTVANADAVFDRPCQAGR